MIRGLLPSVLTALREVTEQPAAPGSARDGTVTMPGGKAAPPSGRWAHRSVWVLFPPYGRESTNASQAQETRESRNTDGCPNDRHDESFHIRIDSVERRSMQAAESAGLLTPVCSGLVA